MAAIQTRPFMTRPLIRLRISVLEVYMIADVSAGSPTGFCTNNPYSARALSPRAVHPQPMLTEIYIKALLVDEELADQVWEAWDKDEADDQTVCIA